MNNIQTTQINVPADIIDFGIGQPGLSLLPLDIMQQAAAHRLAQNDPGLLQYGAEQGDGYFRLALADFLSAGYGSLVKDDQLFVTAGASQGLDLICTLFTKPGDVIFVEEPTYFLALRIFADHHLHVISLPTDEHGLVVDAVEEKLAQYKPVFIYTIPTFQNPSGATLPLTRREQLVALSQEHDFLIVADEVYQLLNYSSVPPVPMAHYIYGETVLSLGSFSKILAPGLRLGWIQTNPALVTRLSNCGLVESGGGLNPFASGIVRSLLEFGRQKQHLNRLKTIYRERAAVLAAALRRDLPELVTFAEPEGGFFIWLKLAQGVDTSQLLVAAQEEQLGFQPGMKFSSQGALRNYMRLSFAFYESSDLEEGVIRLKHLLEKV